MVDLKQVDFYYKREKPLFRQLSLHLERGHIYGLLGTNGAGKTTLLKIISGLCFPENGDCKISGVHPGKRDRSMLGKIFFLPGKNASSSLKIEDYIKLYSPFYPFFNKEKCQFSLQEFGICDLRKRLDELSQGERKKFFISFALATSTDILLFDEPTNALDIPSKKVFRQLIASEMQDHRIIVISTHQVRDLQSLIDAVIMLNEGKVVLNEPVERITRMLTFKMGDHTDDLSDVLYSENSIVGTRVVKENKGKQESSLDIELLFNAMLYNPKRIESLFRNP